MAYPFEAMPDGRFPVIEALVAELGARRDEPLDRLEYLLRNCGFLSERRGDRVVLSDNAHRLDFQYLAEWLPFCSDALTTFPWVNEFLRCKHCNMRYGVGPDGFLQRIHGYKVPAECLDGLVAYLVKALSAVGVITTASCAGHFGFLYVGLHEGCNSAWAAILIRYAATKLRLAHRWEVENGTLFVPRGADADWVRYFLDVLDVAELLYQDRLRLREIRTAIVGQMDGRVKWFSYESILLTMDVLVRGTPLGLQETRIAPE